MQSQRATVIAISGDRVTVRVTRPPACARCAAGRGCGAGLLDGGGRPSILELDAPQGLALRPGDTVSLGMPSEDLLRASFLAYGVPLVAVLLALALLRLAVPDAGDGLSLAAAVLALGATLGATRRWLRRERCTERLRPQVSGMSSGA